MRLQVLQGDYWYNQSSLLTACHIQALWVRNWGCAVFCRAGLSQVSVFTVIFTSGALCSAGGLCAGHALLCPQQGPHLLSPIGPFPPDSR